MTTDDKTIRLNSRSTLKEVLERARRMGEILLIDGDDTFVLRHRDDRLTSTARDFLTKGGPADAD